MPTLLKVAVIDDDPTMLKAMERLLRVKGFDVETFPSAESFLAVEGSASCLILDVQLGGMSGIELQRKLASFGVEIPIIFITANDDDAAEKAAIEGGCVAFLKKPFLASLLIGAIDKAVH